MNNTNNHLSYYLDENFKKIKQTHQFLDQMEDRIKTMISKDDTNQASNTLSFQLSSANTPSQLQAQPHKPRSKSIIRPLTETSQGNCNCGHQNILNQQMVDLILKNEELEQQNAILLNQNEWQEKTIENLSVKVKQLEKILQQQELRFKQISDQRPINLTKISAINDKTPQRLRVKSQHTITKMNQQPQEIKSLTPLIKQDQAFVCQKFLNSLKETLLQGINKEKQSKEELFNIKDILEKSDRQNSSVESKQSNSLINLNQTLKRRDSNKTSNQKGQTNTVFMKEIIDVMIQKNSKDKKQMIKENQLHLRKNSQNYFDWESRQNKLISQVLKDVKENVNLKTTKLRSSNEQKPSTRYERSSSAKRQPSRQIL